MGLYIISPPTETRIGNLEVGTLVKMPNGVIAVVAWSYENDAEGMVKKACGLSRASSWFSNADASEVLGRIAGFENG